MNAPVLPATRDDDEPRSGPVLSSVAMSSAPRVNPGPEVEPEVDPWVLTEETLPESTRHDLLTERIRDLLQAWVDRTGRVAKVGRNLAIHWDEERPQRGAHPDVFLVEPPPPPEEGNDVLSLRLWEPDHVAPQLAVEIVSRTNPEKDYLSAPAKYRECGVGELWILDVGLFGPRVDGGPHRIQIWRRLARGRFARVVAGNGPAWSEAGKGWIHFTREEGGSFGIYADEAGREPWLTTEEAERKAKEEEREAKEAALRKAEAEREAKEAALRKAEAERKAKEAERQAKEVALRKAEAERKAKEKERKAKEVALRKAEAERKAKEAAQREAEAALRELAALKAQLAGGQ